MKKIVVITLLVALLLACVCGVARLIPPRDAEEESETESTQVEQTDNLFTYRQDFEAFQSNLGEFTGEAGAELLDVLGWKVHAFPELSSVSVVQEADAENSYLQVKNSTEEARFTIADDLRLRNGFDMQFDYCLGYGSSGADPFNVLGSESRVGTWNVSIRSGGEILNSCKTDSDGWLYTSGMFTGNANGTVLTNIDRWKTIRIVGSYESGVTVYIKDRGATKWEKIDHYNDTLLHYAKKTSNFMDGALTFFFIKESVVFIDNISVTSLNGTWEFLERLEYGDVSFNEETLARLEQGGRFKVIAFAESSTEEQLWFSAYAELDNNTTMQLFDLKSDVVNVPLECVFEINPADGQKFTNIWINGNVLDTADLYVYVFWDAS